MLAALLFLSPFCLYPQTFAALNSAYTEQQSPVARQLRDAILELKKRHNVNILFEESLLEGKVVEEALINSSSDFELNLQSILAPHQLAFQKVRKNSYLIFSSFQFLKKETVPAQSKNVPVLPNEQAGNTGTEKDPSAPQSANEMVAFLVKGKVMDETSLGLPGVNVIEKGTTNGTVTDTNGEFSLNVADGNAILMFSYIGYAQQEVRVNDQSTLSVAMVLDVKSLSEVVVVGYGTIKKSDLTGSVGSIKAEDVRSLPVRSLTEALQGRVAGVVVTRSNGAPGGGSDIVIRGAGSINGMQPLYIVDGIRMGTGNNFNMQDVESIEVLKDASAAAIYGSAAAGGVILVTTKRGKKDKMDINFNTYYGVRTPVNLPKLLNRDDFVAARQAIGTNTSAWGTIANLPDTDWVNELYGNGQEQSYSLSLSGGSEKATYFVSGSYQREDGIRIDNSFERYSLRFNSDYTINKKLKVGTTLYGWKTGNNPSEGSNFPYRSVPTMALYDETNPLGGWGRAPAGGYFQGTNHVGNERINKRVNKNYGLEGNIYANLEIIPNLVLRTTVAGAILSSHNSVFTQAYDFGPVANPNAVFSKDLSMGENYTFNSVLTYSKMINDHDFTLMAGYEAYKEDRTNLAGTATGFTVPDAQAFELNSDVTSQRVSGGVDENRRVLSQFARMNYAYKSKYLFTANVRRDGDDRFAPANRWGVFPSVSAGWKITEEPFMNVDAISAMKLRVGYGVLGNNGSIARFAYQSSFFSQDVVGLPDGTRIITYGLGQYDNGRLPNDKIKWEEVATTNIGLDVGFLKDRLNLIVDLYQRNTNDLIVSVPVPASPGFNYKTPIFTPINVGQIINKGLEIALDYKGNVNQFTYTIGLVSAFNSNEVTKLDGVQNTPISSGATSIDPLTTPGTSSRTEKGLPIGQFYGYIVDGIYGSQQEVTDRGVTQTGAGVAGPGDLIYRDINDDKIIDAKDRTTIGSPWPKMTYAINLNLGWKGLDIAAQFVGVQGVDIYNATKHYTDNFVSDFNTTENIYKTSFFNGGELTDRPRVGFFNTANAWVNDPNRNYSNISSYYIEDGSYLKLRNLQIGYSLPKSVANKIGMKTARVYVMGQNLFALTSYTGMDPEIADGSGTSGTLSRGVDNVMTYPRTRLFSMGVDIGF